MEMFSWKGVALELGFGQAAFENPAVRLSVGGESEQAAPKEPWTGRAVQAGVQGGNCRSQEAARMGRAGQEDRDLGFLGAAGTQQRLQQEFPNQSSPFHLLVEPFLIRSPKSVWPSWSLTSAS